LRKTLLIAILFLFGTTCFSQGYIDTIRTKLAKATTDSAKIETLYYGAFSKKLLSKSTDSLREELKKFSKSSSCRTRWYAELKLAMYEDFKGLNKEALAHYLKVYSMAEECKDAFALGISANRLGVINMELLNYKTAIEFLHESVGWTIRSGDLDDLAESYSLLGTCFRESEKKYLDSSLYFSLQGLALREKQGNKRKIANMLNNVGLVYKMDHKYEKAVEYLQKALEMRREVKDKKGIAGACINIANCLRELKKYKEGIEYGEEGVKRSLENKDGEFLRNGIWALAELNSKMGEYKAASYYYKRHKTVNDSINIGVMDKNLLELQERFESNKKDLALKEKAHNLELSESENSKKNVLIIFSVIALIMTLVAIIFIYRSYRINKKSAIDLSRKNKLIEEKNKEITDSINYARNIQHSLLSSEKLFKENSSDHFILFKPKDTVSGDFYWARKMNDGFLVMCADCTGHGVPGAFMSLLGITHIKEITNSGISAPDQILNELRKALIDIFSLNDSKDGMDAALVKISGNKLQMSAANNPIWVIRDKISVHIKPNKFPIGKHYGEMGDFTLNEIPLQKNDLIVMFTDGYADQFGGPKNKKYKYKKMEEFIIANCDSNLNDLKSKLEVELKEWRGKNEQIDDVLVIGIRV
jgi:serine phosphatase RsbU (regulator of sigma subunit)